VTGKINGFIPQTVLVVCVILEDPFGVETKGKLSKMAPYCYLTVTQVQQNASGERSGLAGLLNIKCLVSRVIIISYTSITVTLTAFQSIRVA